MDLLEGPSRGASRLLCGTVPLGRISQNPEQAARSEMSFYRDYGITELR